MSEWKEIYFARCIISEAIQRAWNDALNFKEYKNRSKQAEADENRQQAYEWFHDGEFEMWCGALGIDHESILELLIKKYELFEMQRRNKSDVLPKCKERESEAEIVSCLRVEGSDERGVCGEGSEGLLERAGEDKEEEDS
jgi:hypothetical protein